MCFSTSMRKVSSEVYRPILPGLPDDVAKYCLALVPRSDFPNLGAVCKRWRSFIESKECITIRKEAGKLEEWLYVLTNDAEGKGSHWEVLRTSGGKNHLVPPMPGPMKAGFGVVVFEGKILIFGGYLVDAEIGCVSADVHQYDSRLNRIKHLLNMERASQVECGPLRLRLRRAQRLIYVVGGYGTDGERLSSVEAYDPNRNEWTFIEPLRRPRWGCFASAIQGKLFVMGGRSSFSIGNSRSVDIYDPALRSWSEVKKGCVMVTAHAVLRDRLFCMEWKNQRRLVVFDPVECEWKVVMVPLTGSSAIGFRFGVFGGKLLLFSLEEEPGYKTLVYDPDAGPGLEWRTSEIRPGGLCLYSVTIEV
ncbi:F-box/kelch-repeat protein [Acorus calamus]|uniref:F-box/kelch-repeat protein n=1 Tax=Acorus calamus TaxID=4465 RepID=A0AAV9D049_ACOCL|nr:F-box/kelch-repeat protein [Acorus calamus]